MTDTKPAADQLERLRVIERLDVGPAKVERQRIVVPYTVYKRGSSAPDTFELIYRFEEDVFDPESQEWQNLATVMGAQVALNYGLFCDEIVFAGPLDARDERFLIEMAKNTAREIYVKKFLEPNPFLTEVAHGLPAEKRDSYLQAKLLFPNRRESDQPFSNPSAAGNDRSRIAVLSSGGKESLLSYGLLNEAGNEVHSIYINESGRHWFTALNAYRDFKENVPHTARVWTNADRLFSWMLRHLPFIRQDFAQLRSDDYPIRLWTVAVFLFGALPLMWKHGIGRLVIGDEFDTTDKRTHAGIPHYNGLYDQSRYFDQAMTRYFQRKGWGLSQFSVVRPLSELLVEKVLIERYPHLQRLQTSCHATHKEEDRVRPCGRCEKCGRVVGMLSALGGDPQACGYTPAQVRHCLETLARHGAAQEGPALQHLAYLLAERNLLPAGQIAAKQPRERNEIMKLRFDPDRSPMDDVPTDLRQPLYKILLEHAPGASRRSGRTWIDFDLLTSTEIMRPYRFEPPQSARSDSMSPPADGRTNYVLGELTWPEAKERFKEIDVALLPVGAIEQHGPHLPLDTDAYDAECLSREVAARCSDPKPLVLPLIPFGVSYHHDDFSGTISIGPETLSRLVYEVGMSVVRHGITKLVIVNGHGGNGPSLQFAAQLINRDGHIFTCVDSGETSDTDVEALAETRNDVHAGEIETSTSLANRPDLVQMQKAKRSVPKFTSHYLDFSSKRSVDWYARTEKISPSGVMGDPTKATREKGEKMWQLMVEHLVAFIEDLKSMSLDEIHQKMKY